MNTYELITTLQSGGYDRSLAPLCNGKNARHQLRAVLNGFTDVFGGNNDVSLFSAPGRTEIGGNHTDHQRGCVLAASICLDVIAAAAPNGTSTIRIKSKGWPIDEIDLSSLEPIESEVETSAALIRGVAASFVKRGYKVGGFDAYTSSGILKGSGLSSSAAFEVLIATICNSFFADGALTPPELAGIAKYSENEYYGKPCGLMDQMASAVGSVVAIDFANEKAPTFRRIPLNLEAEGYSLCIINSGANHAALTDEYAAITKEMSDVAAFFGKKVLSELDSNQLFANVAAVRAKCGDRAFLRAVHYFDETARAVREADYLEAGRFDDFLKEVNASGRSSCIYLQNAVPCGAVNEQAILVALACCERLLKGRGAFRLHGGGFAGTVQAFVPLDILDDFVAGISESLGAGKCHVLSIREAGSVELKPEIRS